jgi:hypothetical protein
LSRLYIRAFGIGPAMTKEARFLAAVDEPEPARLHSLRKKGRLAPPLCWLFERNPVRYFFLMYEISIIL